MHALLEVIIFGTVERQMLTSFLPLPAKHSQILPLVSIPPDLFTPLQYILGI